MQLRWWSTCTFARAVNLLRLSKSSSICLHRCQFDAVFSHQDLFKVCAMWRRQRDCLGSHLPALYSQHLWDLGSLTISDWRDLSFAFCCQFEMHLITLCWDFDGSLNKKTSGMHSVHFWNDMELNIHLAFPWGLFATVLTPNMLGNYALGPNESTSLRDPVSVIHHTLLSPSHLLRSFKLICDSN